MMELGMLVRALVTVGFLALLLRLLGKRGFLITNPLHLIVAVILGRLAHAMVLGQMPFAFGIVAIGSLLWLHLLAITLLPRVSRVGGESAVLVQQGRVQPDTLQREAIPDLAVESLLRQSGGHRLAHVRELRVEPDGTLVRVPTVAARPLRRGELPESATTHEEEEPWQRAA